VVKHDASGVLPLAEFATIEDVLAGLRERGGRVTPAPRLLLSTLFRDRAHRSAEELAEEVQAQAPAVNISTIYRNLGELTRRPFLSGAFAGVHGPLDSGPDPGQSGPGVPAQPRRTRRAGGQSGAVGGEAGPAAVLCGGVMPGDACFRGAATAGAAARYHGQDCRKPIR
jgi:Ferric uptake regulator family